MAMLMLVKRKRDCKEQHPSASQQSIMLRSENFMAHGCYKILLGDQLCQHWIKNYHIGDYVCPHHQGQWSSISET
jgi:hypothetical protein